MFLETQILLDHWQCAQSKTVIFHSRKNKILHKTMTTQIFTGETSNKGGDVFRSKDKQRTNNFK